MENLKSKVDKLDFHKYKTAPIDLKKPSDFVDDYLMKRNIVWYLTKVTDIKTKISSTTGFINKSQNDIDKKT